MFENRNRRSFLSAMLASGAYVYVSAAFPGTTRAFAKTQHPKGRFAFPQGIASADPTPRSVVLWTRVVDNVDPDSNVDMTVEMSKSSDFNELVLQRSIRAMPKFDHTVRVLVDELDPASIYYYRFSAGRDRPMHTGRTRTAPSDDEVTNFNFAVVSCQNFQTGYFTGYRTMRIDDDNVGEKDKIDFILHVGDFIYEAIYDSPWGAQSEQSKSIGPSDRKIGDFPSGGGQGDGFRFARTVQDYRHLYRLYLSDLDLQAARAFWPFVHTWDDHEFTNDSWQSHDTYSGNGRFDPARKMAANQAWFEYIPALLTGGKHLAGSQHAAHDLRLADLKGGEESTDLKIDPAAFGYKDSSSNTADADNKKAIDSLTIYRKLRYGALGEFIITDNRSYRSDHPVPEELAVDLLGSSTTGRQSLPVSLVTICDAGKNANGGNPPDTLTFNGKTRQNPRKGSEPGSILGKVQKQWWKQSVKQSNARWCFWSNSVPLMPLRFDFSNYESDQDDIIMSADSWEGYPTERKELLEFLSLQNISNLISLCGDYHVNMAGVLESEDHEISTGLGYEFAVAGISSTSIQEVYAMFGSEEFAPLITSAPLEEGEEEENGLNLTFLKGVEAAREYAEANFSERSSVAFGAPKTSTAQHLRYIDTRAYGYLRIAVNSEGVSGTFVQIERPLSNVGKNGASIQTRASLNIGAGGQHGMKEATFSGKVPFPYPKGEKL